MTTRSRVRVVITKVEVVPQEVQFRIIEVDNRTQIPYSKIDTRRSGYIQAQEIRDGKLRAVSVKVTIVVSRHDPLCTFRSH